MLKRNDIQIDLLKKFNELCKKANVNYVLHGHAAFLAYFNEPFNQVNSFEVLMCQGDAEKIHNLLDDEKYYFEDSRNNPKFNRNYMMFGYKNSLDIKNKDLNFHTTRHIENHCIRIIIHFIERPVRRISGKVLRINHKISKIRNLKRETDFNNFTNKKKYLNYAFKVVPDNLYNRSIYSFKKNRTSIDSWDAIKKYPLIKITGKKPIESTVFESIESVVLNEIPTFILKDFETYAEHFYGKNWQQKNWSAVNRFTSSAISWDEYSKDVDVIKKINEIEDLYVLIYEKALKTVEERKIMREFRKHIRQSGRVIYLREEIVQQKEDIINYYQSGNMGELESIFEPLIQAQKIGINRGYTFSVDDDIDNILDSYLRQNKMDDLADKIKELKADI